MIPTIAFVLLIAILAYLTGFRTATALMLAALKRAGFTRRQIANILDGMKTQ